MNKSMNNYTHQVLNKELHVLFIEDTEDDMLLELAELENAGYQVTYQCVDTTDELTKAMQQQWDLLISDYNLPLFTGLDALNIVRNKDSEVPFILVSGAIGEEGAVQVMKAGAQDYINKNMLLRLVPVVQRELKDAQLRIEHKQSILDRQENEQRLQQALKASGQAPWDLDLITKKVTLSHEYVAMLGYRLEQFDTSEEGFAKKLHPSDRNRVFSTFNAYLKGELTIYKEEFRMKTQSGAWKWISTIGEIVERDQHGKPLRMVGTHTDIDEDKLKEQNLRESEEQLKEAQMLGRMGSLNWDIQTNMLSLSDEVFRIIEENRTTFQPSFKAFTDKIYYADKKRFLSAIDKALHKMQAFSIDYRIQLADGSIRYVHEQCEVRFNDDGKPLRMIGTLQDITEHKLSELALLKSEKRFRSTFEQAAVGIAHVDLYDNWLKVNQKFFDIIDYTQKDLDNLNLNDITHVDDIEIDKSLKEELLTGKQKQYQIEKRFIQKDKSIVWINLTASLVFDDHRAPEYFIIVIENISLRKQAEEKILNNLHEKEALLRELHHRVKNNMQVISSMLNLQSRYSDSNNLEEAYQQSRQRIRAMSLIHERMYAAQDLSKIEFNAYLHYLGERLERLYHNPSWPINIQVSGEPLPLSIDTALPLALIVNEVITNTIKHAYVSDKEKRLIDIRLNKDSKQQCFVSIRDYGQGMKTPDIEQEPKTLGLLLIRSLSRQIGADIKFEKSKGTLFTISFPWVEIKRI